MMTGLLAQAVANRRQCSAYIYARFDDTNVQRTRDVSTKGLLYEIQEVAQVPLAQPPHLLGVDGIALYQSKRQPRYEEALNRLIEMGVVRDHDGTWHLSIDVADRLLRAQHVNPSSLVSDALVNINSVPTDPSQASVPLFRRDGTPLWHLASVVDDIDLGITLIVRGTDKINAVAVQERVRCLLSNGRSMVAYVFLPRLMEEDREMSRVAQLLSSGYRSSSLRWYLAEPFAKPSAGAIPLSFDELARSIHSTGLSISDATFDLRRLSSLDRKVSAQILEQQHHDELIERLGSTHAAVISMIAREWRRSIPDQIRIFDGITSDTPVFDPAPRDAADGISWLSSYRMRGKPLGKTPFSVRWVLTGCSAGPPPDAILDVFPNALIPSRLASAIDAAQNTG